MSKASPATSMWRVGSVRFLNARPLVDGLRPPVAEVVEDVPSRLLGRLLEGEIDVGLCPVADYQTSPEALRILPAGGIGCDGAALTVRLFSRVRPERIEELAADVDSHTSVVLAQLVLARRYGARPRVVPHDVRAPDVAHRAEGLLLIGDKVVTEPPSRAEFPFDLDLGVEWKRLTGRPFVFAVWTARAAQPLAGLQEVLARQREANRLRLEEIASAHGPRLGWPQELALRYLTEFMRYETGPAELEAIETFWQEGWKAGFWPQTRAPRSRDGSLS